MSRALPDRYRRHELRGQLAAAYVLGTLRDGARARFEKLLRDDATLGEEVVFWQERFSEFATRLRPIAPREMVWAALERTIHAKPAIAASQVFVPAAARAVAKRRNGPSPRLWQAWALAATVAAVALGIGWQREHAQAEALSQSLAAVENQPAPYVAVIQPAGGDARWAITLHPTKDVMRIVLTGNRMPADVTRRSLELWMLDSKGKPHSLGLLPVTAGAAKEMPLARIPAAELGAALTLAISEEPRGGSPTGLPTGKVLGAVPAVKPI